MLWEVVFARCNTLGPILDACPCRRYGWMSRSCVKIGSVPVEDNQQINH
jgi:hypothetical protein